VHPQDKETGEILAKAISGIAQQYPPYSRDELVLTAKGEEFLNKLYKRDVLSVGGPVLLDPLYEPMKNKGLPCSYEIEKPLAYPLEQTGGNLRYRYELVRRSKQEPLIPEWNQLNWGLITCMEKSIIFPKEAKGGLFFNISGCNWFGSRGVALFLYQRGNLRKLKEAVERKIGKSKNYQAVLRVPIDPFTRTGMLVRPGELMEEEIYKIS